MLAEAGRPGLVSESGWPSAFVRKATSPAQQAAWIRALRRLSDRANLVFVGQILYSDLDAAIPVAENSILEFFAYQGLVDQEFNDKPALAEWDRIFRLPYQRR